MKDNFLHACWFCKLHGRSHRVQLFTSCMQHAWVELNISSAIQCLSSIEEINAIWYVLYST